jgi:hypothetical protein
MRSLFALALLGSLIGPIPVRADNDENTKAILTRGIKALGGEANLNKYKAATWKVKMKVFAAGMVLDASGEDTVQWPGRYRAETEDGVLLVLSGEKGWVHTSGGTKEIDNAALANYRRALYFRWIPVTVVPLKEKGFKLAAAGEEKVGGRPAVGIKVTAPDGQLFQIHFDKENGLPVKMAMNAKNESTGTELSFARLFSNYKEIQGVKVATKVVEQDLDAGKTMSETEISDFKFADKLDDKVFAKP